MMYESFHHTDSAAGDKIQRYFDSAALNDSLKYELLHLYNYKT